MKLAHYHWYSSSAVVTSNDGYSVVISVKSIDNKVRKTVPRVVDGVSIKTELE
jgi:hypothetical protein